MSQNSRLHCQELLEGHNEGERLKSQLQVIAEVNTSHFGSIESALRACNVAMESGANFVKFQSWSAESLFTSRYLESRSLEHRMYDKFALSSDDLRFLRNECKELGIGFGSTAYSSEEVIALENMEADFIKIASMDAVTPPLIQSAARTGLPTIISTGMATVTEIEQAVDDYVQAGGSSLTLLHCTSIYPTPLGESSLGNVAMLQSMFPDIPIGFSDHTQGISAAAAAIGLGVRVFEKHFTLDSSKPGFDNAMAETQEGLAAYVASLTALQQSLAQRERVISLAEEEQAKLMRRSAFFSKNLSQGAILTMDALEFKRPGHGVSYRAALALEGRRLDKNVEMGEMLQEKFLNSN